MWRMHAHTRPRGARLGAGANGRVQPVESINAERFWSCADVGGEGDCWPWLTAASRPERGGQYGTYYELGRTLSAHRVAYRLHYGRWPERQIRHLCGRSLCVNPLHLAEGTQAENEQDKVIHGTVHYLSEQPDVIEAIASGCSSAELAKRFGVHPATARRWRQRAR